MSNHMAEPELQFSVHRSTHGNFDDLQIKNLVGTRSDRVDSNQWKRFQYGDICHEEVMATTLHHCHAWICLWMFTIFAHWFLLRQHQTAMEIHFLLLHWNITRISSASLCLLHKSRFRSVAKRRRFQYIQKLIDYLDGSHKHMVKCDIHQRSSRNHQSEIRIPIYVWSHKRPTHMGVVYGLIHPTMHISRLEDMVCKRNALHIRNHPIKWR